MAEQYAAVGRVVQVIGPVMDIQFEAKHLPAIYNAVRITSEGFKLPEPLDVTARGSVGTHKDGEVFSDSPGGTFARRPVHDARNV